MKTLFLHLLLATAFFLGNAIHAETPPSTTAYLFTSFRGNGDGLHLAYSHDALDWTDLDRVFLTPTVGGKLLRDPHILFGPDHLYHMVWTSGWKDTGIGHATSEDLVHWSGQQYISLMEKTPGAQNCWAPETFYDDATKNYILVWSSNVPSVGSTEEHFRAWYSLTRDFKTFSDPKVLFDPGFNNIDTTMLRRADGKYLILLKETDQPKLKKWGAIHAAVADKPLGPYQLLPDLAFANERVEGPSPITIGDKTLLYADYYVNGRYAARETTDWKTWTDIAKSTAVANGQRHGTIFSVPVDLAEKLRQESAAVAPKPILEGFNADPAIRVFGDTYYIYPTSDKPYWNTTEFPVFSSKNLIDWKKERIVLDVTKDLQWADLQAWAPDCVERNGTYYFYFCARGKIGVATAPTPTGPFKDALNHPLLVKGGKVNVTTIDPYPFIDSDGQGYLYYGNGRCAQVIKLKADMITLDGDPVDIPMKDFREGIVVFKRDGKYYFMWSIDDARSPNYRVGWGISDTPFGPVKIPETDFIVLQKNGPVVGTAHHSVVNVPGTDRWYVAYHRHAVPGGGGYKREVCLVRMEFNPDGSIKPMDPMVVPFKLGDLGEPISHGKGLPDPR
ncbi:MAG: family 43 glycosylhydrolase [Chthoniobacterales bacterium]